MKGYVLTPCIPRPRHIPPPWLRPHYLRFVDLVDIAGGDDEDGCSIDLHLDIEEDANNDFLDLTTAIPLAAAPVVGVGIPQRVPAKEKRA